MEIGKLRHRVTLQESAAVRDSFGAEVETWTDITTLWASVEPLSGREYFAAQQVNTEISTKITLRYRAGIKPEMQILFASRVFEILSVVNPEEKNTQLVLMCKEVPDNGSI